MDQECTNYKENYSDYNETEIVHISYESRVELTYY